MKATLLALAAILAAPVAFGQQAAPLPPLVTTIGSAQIRVVPDLADLYFEVEVRNVDLAQARKEQAERATKVLAALRAAGIAEVELQSSQVHITADFTDRKTESARLNYYRVSQSINCTLHDLRRVPDVTAAAVIGGADSVNPISLRTSGLRKYRDQARARAIQAAREKAAALAKELGASLGRPYMIVENPTQYDAAQNNTNANNSTGPMEDPAGDEPMATFAPGTVDVNATIRVSFLLLE